MSFSTAQQTKLDLELVPKENRLDIGKCNERIPLFRDIFQICPRVQGRDFDALPSEEDTVSFLRELSYTREINSLNDVVVDQMHQPWRTFAALINRDLERLVVLTSFVSLELKYFGIYRAILSKCLTSPTMKESKTYKTFLSYATGVVPPKITRKFMKASPSKKDSNLVPVDEEPVTKGKRVKISVKKSSTKPTTSIIIRKPPMETTSKRKEEVDVTRGKGIDLLSEVALTEEAEIKEVRKKSLRDFHKTHPSGSGTVAEKPPRVDKITPTFTNEGTCDKPGVLDVTEDDSTESESETWGNDEDDSNDDNDEENKGNDEENKNSEFDQHEYEKEVKDDNEEEDIIVHTPSNSDDEEDANLESMNDDKYEGDEDRGIDDTTNQFSDDVQDKEADVEMTDAQQEKENLEITQEHVVEDAHVNPMNFPPVNRKFSPGSRKFPTANRKFPTASRKFPTGSTKCSTADMGMKGKAVKPSSCSSQNTIDDKVYWDSGCSRHMTGNISYLSDYKSFDGGYVSFGQEGCKITGKGTIKTEEDIIVHTPSNSDDEEDANLESMNDDKYEGDEDRGIDDTTNQFSDDVQDKEADVEMTDAQQEKENLEITQEHVVKDAHVTISTIAKETKVPDASFSHSFDLTSKFLNFLDMHPNDVEIVSPLDVHIHHEVPRIHTSTLLIVSVLVIPEASPVCTTIPQSSQTFTSPLLLTTLTPPPTIETTDIHLQFLILIQSFYSTKESLLWKKMMGATREEFMNFLSESLTARITKQVKNQLPQILLEEVSNFAPPVIKKMIKESLNQVNLAKASSQPQSTYEAAATLTEFELKKNLINKMSKTKSFLIALKHQECYDDKDKDEDPFAGSDRRIKRRKTSKDTEPTTGPKTKDSMFGSSKGTKSQPKSSRKNVQLEVPEFEVAFLSFSFDQGRNLGNGDDEPRKESASKQKLDWENLKGSDYPFDLTKPLPLVKVRNRQKVSADYFFNNDLKYLQGGILTMTYTTSLTKTKDAHYDLSSIKDMVPNIWMTRVDVIKKHEYGYLREIEVRRADNVLYTFKEGDFPRLRLNDIEDMLILVAQNWLTNLSGDDVVDFAIALKLFTRSLVIKKKSKILNSMLRVTKRRLVFRYYELYKFSDGTLTRLLTSLEDINKNIHMRYLPKRRWSSLEKKRSHFMIKEINKLLKERSC
nr:hypothetical protein [Tanacetum cinerariifolium]